MKSLLFSGTLALSLLISCKKNSLPTQAASLSNFPPEGQRKGVWLSTSEINFEKYKVIVNQSSIPLWVHYLKFIL
jgi:hypothetical protein